MRETERLGSLLEMYNAAVSELMSWQDPGVADLIVRLELWRTATELEVRFADEREHAVS
jgi:hypothetical protein